MKEKLAGLVLGTVLTAGGCGGPQSAPKPESTPQQASNTRIEFLGNPGDAAFYKSTDLSNGQVCYIAIAHDGFGRGTGAAISCPTITK